MSRPDFKEIAREWLVRAMGHARTSTEESLGAELERVYGLGSDEDVAKKLRERLDSITTSVLHCDRQCPQCRTLAEACRAILDATGAPPPFFAVDHHADEPGHYSNVLPPETGDALEASMRASIAAAAAAIAGAPLDLRPHRGEPRPPDVLGTCAACGGVIREGEPYSFLRPSSPVRGRIGAPSGEITGVAVGPAVWTCGKCIEARGEEKC